MKKAYGKLALRFHPEKNDHSHASDMMLMRNEAEEELEEKLRYNGAIRKQ